VAGGPYAITLGSLSAGSNYSINFTTGVTFAITKKPLTVQGTAAPQPVQYSDPVTLSGAVSGFAFSETLATSGVTGSASCTSPAVTSGKATGAPGPATVTCTIGTLDAANYSFPAANFTPGTFTISQEDARSTYTGDMLGFTSGSGGTATVTLRATIQDITAVTGDLKYDADAGNITNAKVTFASSGGTLNNCSNLSVSLLGGDPKTGTVSCTGTFSSGNGGSMEYTITTTVGGYYTDTSIVVPTVLEIADPTGTFITGGGYLNEVSSAGSNPAANPSKMNFGFNVKYNKNGSNPQGHINVIYRSGGHVYQIKTTATDAFGTSLKTPGGVTCTGPPSASCLGSRKLVVEGQPD
jgi:hypothetical protein